MKRLEAHPHTVHWGYFSRDLEPVLRVRPGEPVEIETLSYPTEADIPELRTPRLERILEQVTPPSWGGHLLTGPIHVETAEPGDVLVVHIDAIRPLLPFAYNRIRPGHVGRGLLPEDFPEGKLRVLAVDVDRGRVIFAEGIELPLRPFFGVMGVAPPHDGRVSTLAPGDFGGNMDIKELVEGTTLYLPVFVSGALFSVGDGHVVQGDGEVCLSAAEASMAGVFRFEVRRDLRLERPMVETPTHIMTTGFHEDLDQAAKIAVRDMIRWLGARHGMDPMDAYSLCSLALDLHISQVVNGRKGIHAMLGKAVLEHTSI